MKRSHQLKIHANGDKGPLVQCHHCHGSGKIHLSDDMLSTLNALKMFTDKQGVTSLMVGNKLEWTGHPTAINNRLEDLRKLGLVTRKRISQSWHYKAVK